MDNFWVDTLTKDTCLDVSDVTQQYRTGKCWWSLRIEKIFQILQVCKQATNQPLSPAGAEIVHLSYFSTITSFNIKFQRKHMHPLYKILITCCRLALHLFRQVQTTSWYLRRFCVSWGFDDVDSQVSIVVVLTSHIAYRAHGVNPTGFNSEIIGTNKEIYIL